MIEICIELQLISIIKFNLNYEGKIYGITEKQIELILESVPAVFPENWKSPNEFFNFKNENCLDKLTSEQQKLYAELGKLGFYYVPCQVIENVIKLRNLYRT